MKSYLVQNQEFLLHCQPVVFSHVYLKEYIFVAKIAIKAMHFVSLFLSVLGQDT